MGQHLTAEQRWVVATPGSTTSVEQVGTLHATPYPCPQDEPPPADPLSLIASLEALRAQGHSTFVLPEGSRSWFERHPELRDHVTRHYATVADQVGAAAIFDLTHGAGGQRRSLLAEINDIAADLATAPAVLNWSGADLATELPGFTTFEPPEGDVLPYLDRSVDIVVTTPANSLSEAERVASRGVVMVEGTGGQVSVVDVQHANATSSVGHLILICAPATANPHLETALHERAAECGATLTFDSSNALANSDAEVVVFLDANVLPLPGSIAIAAAWAQGHPGDAMVGKALDAKGRIEAAGGMVFSDSSVAGTAAGTFDVRAPWHEFVRPTCWGDAMIAVSRSLLATLPLPTPGNLIDWCGELWAKGATVTYQPAAAVVRTSPHQVASAAGKAWSSALTSRPEQPASLSDGAWRYLIANIDAAALAPKARS